MSRVIAASNFCVATLFALAILTACGISPPPSVTEVPQVVETPKTKTVTPTKPLPPTKLPSTPTYPPLPESFQNNEIDVDAYNTQIAPFQEKWYSCGDYNPWIMDFSPEKNWIATSCEHQGGNISLINAQGKIWRITDKQLFGVVENIVFNPEKWAKDGKSLYFSTTHPYPSFGVPAETPTLPPGNPTELPWCFNPYTVTLIKADFETHTTKFILGNQDSYKNDWPDNFYAFALSPEENYLAYSLQDRKQSKIFIKNLVGDAKATFVIESGTESDIVVTELMWFPDETKILAELTYCKDTKRKLSIIDLQSDQQEIIPIEIPEGFYVRGWDQIDLIILEKSNNYYYLDVKTNKIVGPIS
jgi:hypothetical protein